MKVKNIFLGAVLFNLLLSGCDSSSSTSSSDTVMHSASGNVAELQPVETNSAIEVIAFSKTDLCKAVIATQFYKPVKIISVYMETSDEIRVQYERTEDKTIWKNKCKVEGNTIVWGAVDPDRVGDEQAGRWRTRYAEGDDQITYSVENENLILTTTSQYSGKSSTQVFHKSDFTKSKRT